MYAEKVKRRSECQWVIEPFGTMQVPVVVYADDELMRGMDEQVYKQAANVASLPGVVQG
ncbi:MAG TPA: RNA-splicing ligase RtcB, partial [Phycisphaerales bacterium]|nr:RNA-splicing ligase RtcB [Phycisphaerales bacterium]